MTVNLSLHPLETTTLRPGRTRPWFYVAMAVVMLVAVIAGFWPRYYGPLVNGIALKPQVQFWAIHVHSAVFLGWLICFVIQAGLVWRGRTPLHRRLGVFMAIYGLLAVVVGVWGGLAISLRKMTDGATLDKAAAFLFIPLSDMVMFAGFLTAAIAYRRKPEIHKRLMLMAALTLALVGTGRLLMHVFPTLLFEQRWLFGLAWLSPILLGMGHDFFTRRRVHPVYLIGVVPFVPRVNLQPIMESEAWLLVGRALLRPFL